MSARAVGFAELKIPQDTSEKYKGVPKVNYDVLANGITFPGPLPSNDAARIPALIDTSRHATVVLDPPKHPYRRATSLDAIERYTSAEYVTADFHASEKKILSSYSQSFRF